MWFWICVLPQSANERKKLTLTLFIIQDDFSNGSCDRKDIILQESRGLMYDHCGWGRSWDAEQDGGGFRGDFFPNLSTGNPAMQNWWDCWRHWSRCSGYLSHLSHLQTLPGTLNALSSHPWLPAVLWTCWNSHHPRWPSCPLESWGKRRENRAESVTVWCIALCFRPGFIDFSLVGRYQAMSSQICLAPWQEFSSPNLPYLNYNPYPGKENIFGNLS